MILEYNDKIEKLKVKKIGKGSNIFLRVITFGFVNGNQKNKNLQNNLEADKFRKEGGVKLFESENLEKEKEKKENDTNHNQEMQDLDTIMNDLEKIRIEYETKTAKYSSKVEEKIVDYRKNNKEVKQSYISNSYRTVIAALEEGAKEKSITTDYHRIKFHF